MRTFLWGAIATAAVLTYGEAIGLVVPIWGVLGALLVAFVIGQGLTNRGVLHEPGHRWVGRLVGVDIVPISAHRCVGSSCTLVGSATELPRSGWWPASVTTTDDLRRWRLRSTCSALAGPLLEVGVGIALVVVGIRLVGLGGLMSIVVGAMLVVNGAGQLIPWSNASGESDGVRVHRWLTAPAPTERALVIADQWALGRADLAAGRGEAAVERLTWAFEQAPQLPALGVALLDALDAVASDEAPDLARQLLSSVDLDDGDRGNLLARVALADVAGGDPALVAEAEACLGRAEALLGGEPAVLGVRGALEVDAGRPAEGLELLMRADRIIRVRDGDLPPTLGAFVAAWAAIACARSANPYDGCRWLTRARSFGRSEPLVALAAAETEEAIAAVDRAAREAHERGVAAMGSVWSPRPAVDRPAVERGVVGQPDAASPSAAASDSASDDGAAQR